jgi:hypothetical protein
MPPLAATTALLAFRQNDVVLGIVKIGLESSRGKAKEFLCRLYSPDEDSMSVSVQSG